MEPAVYPAMDWLEENIENRSIWFQQFEDFTEIEFIGCGGYGAVCKAKLTTGKNVAYKILHPHNEDEIIKNIVDEVGDYNDEFISKYYC